MTEPKSDHRPVYASLEHLDGRGVPEHMGGGFLGCQRGAFLTCLSRVLGNEPFDGVTTEPTSP
jgi:hypothetical protein